MFAVHCRISFAEFHSYVLLTTSLKCLNIEVYENNLKLEVFTIFNWSEKSSIEHRIVLYRYKFSAMSNNLILYVLLGVLEITSNALWNFTALYSIFLENV